MSITIGVDPGKTGALALIDSYGVLVDCYDMPLAGGLVSAQLLNDLECWDADTFGTVVVEDVHAMPRQGVSSVFSFGRSKGVIEGLFAAHRKPIVYVSPAKWKRGLGLTADKGASRRRACELWPARSTLFARVKDDGRAEAALIAHWWLKHGEGRG